MTERVGFLSALPVRAVLDGELVAWTKTASRTSSFGTSERTLYAYPPAGGKNAILREWSVTLIGVTPGKYAIRYRSASRSLGTTDATWTFIVQG